MAVCDLDHAAVDLVGRQDFLLDQKIADGLDPFLVIGGVLVFLLGVVLDDAAHGVDLERGLLVASSINMASVRFSQRAGSCS
ncbi:MAG: hypothetical protein R3D67_13150 [Hyphomicrobiaceae bacterium]